MVPNTSYALNVVGDLNAIIKIYKNGVEFTGGSGGGGGGTSVWTQNGSDIEYTTGLVTVNNNLDLLEHRNNNWFKYEKFRFRFRLEILVMFII